MHVLLTKLEIKMKAVKTMFLILCFVFSISCGSIAKLIKPAKSEIFGEVLTKDGLAVVGAKVSTKPESEDVYTSKTGSFRISNNLKPGPIKLIAEHEKYEIGETTTTLKKNKKGFIRIILGKKIEMDLIEIEPGSIPVDGPGGEAIVDPN